MNNDCSPKDQKTVGWSVVKFVDQNEIEAIPSSWVLNSQECLWPPYETNVIKKSIRSCRAPEDHWKIYNIKLLSKSCNKFCTATSMASKAQLDSDLETEDNLPEKRIAKRNTRYITDTESEENYEYDRDEYDLEDFPQPPQIMKERTISKQKEKCKMSMLAVDNNDPKISIIEDILIRPFNNSRSQELSNYRRYTKEGPAEEIHKDIDISLSSNSTNVLGTVSTQIKELIKVNLKTQQKIEQQSHIIDEMNTKIAELIEHVSKNQINGSTQLELSSEVDELYEKFPIKTDEELLEIENILKPEYITLLSKQFARVGGSDYKECVRRIMPRILSDEVASNYSFTGHKAPKRRFLSLKICALAIKSVEAADKKKNCLKDIEKELSIWLTKSSQRIESKINIS